MKQANKTKKELKTQFSYNRLWKMLIDRNIQKQELQKMSEVSAASIAKMGRCENVTTDVLLRICEALDCKVEDIMERVPCKKTESMNEKSEGKVISFCEQREIDYFIKNKTITKETGARHIVRGFMQI